MKKEYVIIGAVVLTIGYFVLINNKLKGFPKKIDDSKIKEVIMSSVGGMMVTKKVLIYDTKYQYSKNSFGEVDLWDKETDLHAQYDANGNFKSIYDPSKIIMN